MEKQFKEFRELLLSIDSKHFTWNDARADVLNKLHDLQSKVENLSISDVSVSTFIKDCQTNAMEQAKLFETKKMIESQQCSEAMAFAYGVCLDKVNEYSR